jgi:hypothetical protein
MADGTLIFSGAGTGRTWPFQHWCDHFSIFDTLSTNEHL